MIKKIILMVILSILLLSIFTMAKTDSEPQLIINDDGTIVDFQDPKISFIKEQAVIRKLEVEPGERIDVIIEIYSKNNEKFTHSTVPYYITPRLYKCINVGYMDLCTPENYEKMHTSFIQTRLPDIKINELLAEPYISYTYSVKIPSDVTINAYYAVTTTFATSNGDVAQAAQTDYSNVFEIKSDPITVCTGTKDETEFLSIPNGEQIIHKYYKKTSFDTGLPIIRDIGCFWELDKTICNTYCGDGYEVKGSGCDQYCSQSAWYYRCDSGIISIDGSASTRCSEETQYETNECQKTTYTLNNGDSSKDYLRSLFCEKKLITYEYKCNNNVITENDKSFTSCAKDKECAISRKEFITQKTSSYIQDLMCEDKPIICPMDVQTCPDGSTVSRMPPDCEFQECDVIYECITDNDCDAGYECVDNDCMKESPIYDCTSNTDCGTGYICTAPNTEDSQCVKECAQIICPDGTVISECMNNELIMIDGATCDELCDEDTICDSDKNVIEFECVNGALEFRSECPTNGDEEMKKWIIIGISGIVAILVAIFAIRIFKKKRGKK